MQKIEIRTTVKKTELEGSPKLSSKVREYSDLSIGFKTIESY